VWEEEQVKFIEDNATPPRQLADAAISTTL
jgi:hypothetical protein